MKNKKKKSFLQRLRYDRLLSIILVIVFIHWVGSSCFTKILSIQEENRNSISVEVFGNGYRYLLNADEFIHYRTTKELPSIEEFNKLMYKKEMNNENNYNNTSSNSTTDIIINSKQGLTYLGEFKLTGYCNCEDCCGKWAGGPCYNGEMPVEGLTIAVDTDVIPINSYVIINGTKYKAMDTGSAIKGNRIDVYCENHSDCFKNEYNCYAEVYLINEKES